MPVCLIYGGLKEQGKVWSQWTVIVIWKTTIQQSLSFSLSSFLSVDCSNSLKTCIATGIT